MRRLLLTVVVAGSMLLFTWLILQNRSSKSTYLDFGAAIPGDYQLLGIDVSHHQGKINWKNVGAMHVGNDSVGFVYIKSTEGITYVDDRWKENAKGALEENIPFGLYHFMRLDVSAKRQAEIFALKCLEAKDTLRPMLDVERSCGFGAKRIADSVETFIAVFEKKMKMKPIIYTYESFFNDYFKNSRLKNEYFWIANYNGHSDAIQRENVVIWQFSESGTVNGIETKVDLNVAGENFGEVMFQD